MGIRCRMGIRPEVQNYLPARDINVMKACGRRYAKHLGNVRTTDVKHVVQEVARPHLRGEGPYSALEFGPDRFRVHSGPKVAWP